jgi:hypothetical protein
LGGGGLHWPPPPPPAGYVCACDTRCLTTARPSVGLLVVLVETECVRVLEGVRQWVSVRRETL